MLALIAEPRFAAVFAQGTRAEVPIVGRHEGRLVSGQIDRLVVTSDEVLIERIANGDRLAMQVLFARHHVRVYRFVLRLVRNEATAEDLISDVFLSADFPVSGQSDISALGLEWRAGAGTFRGALEPVDRRDRLLGARTLTFIESDVRRQWILAWRRRWTY